MVKIKIKPKTEIVAALDERLKERQDAYCEEIRNLRCELEMMKTAMDEMKRHMNEIQVQMQLQSGYNSNNGRYGRADINACGSMSNGNSAESDFSGWISGLELTLQDLEKMFESNDLVDWASKFIVEDLKQRSGNPYPICAIKGSKNEMIIYDNNVWRKMTDHEFSSIIMNKMFKKLLGVFTAWKNENYNRILTSEQFSTLYHSNYARILSFNENPSKLKMKLFHML